MFWKTDIFCRDLHELYKFDLYWKLKKKKSMVLMAKFQLVVYFRHLNFHKNVEYFELFIGFM